MPFGDQEFNYLDIYKMAQYQHLPIYKATYDLLNLITKNSKILFKYNIQQTIDQGSLTYTKELLHYEHHPNLLYTSLGNSISQFQ